jgi:hypothetical protein
MMKNKLFCSLLFCLTLSLALVSCKPEVDVFDSMEKLASTTLIGRDSTRSGAMVTDLSIRVVEYKFLPENKAVRTETTVGDGVYVAPTSMNLSYVMEYTENYVGMNILFTPEDGEQAPFNVFFNDNVLVENGTDTLTDVVAKVANLDRIMTDLPNTTWYYKDSTLWLDSCKVFDYIKHDTILKPVIGIINGKPGIVRVDTTFKSDSIFKDSIVAVGTKTYTKYELTFKRDANSLANTGSYSYVHAEYTKDSVLVDSVSESTYKDFNWGVYSISTNRRFVIRTISADVKKEVEDIAISLFMEAIKDPNNKDLIIGRTMKVGGTTEYKLK